MEMAPRQGLVVVGALVSIAAGGLAGCSDSSGTSGDCLARLDLDGVRYVANGYTVDTPPKTSSSLGQVDVLGCTEGGEGLEVVDTAAALKIDGVETGIAIAVKKGYPGVYVAASSDPEDWPKVIRKP